MKRKIYFIKGELNMAKQSLINQYSTEELQIIAK
jgi:hypothetical protein